MKIVTKSIAAFALAAGLTAASVVYAHDSSKPSGSMMGPGMMGQGGMMNMMGQMGQMMEHCNQMMGDTARENGAKKPNEQWRKDAPTTPEK